MFGKWCPPILAAATLALSMTSLSPTPAQACASPSHIGTSVDGGEAVSGRLVVLDRGNSVFPPTSTTTDVSSSTLPLAAPAEEPLSPLSWLAVAGIVFLVAVLVWLAIHDSRG